MDTSKIEIITCNNNDIGINSYVLKTNQHCIVIDPNNFDEIVMAIGNDKLDYIFLTHEHFDHIKSIDRLRDKYGVKLIAQEYASQNIQSSVKNLSKFSNLVLEFMGKTITEPFEEIVIEPADIVFENNYQVFWEGYNFSFQHTPGHSAGSCCISVEDILFVGDSLFELCEPMLKGPGTSRKDYNKITLPYFHSLDGSTRVFSGHYNGFVLGNKLSKIEEGKLK